MRSKVHTGIDAQKNIMEEYINGIEIAETESMNRLTLESNNTLNTKALQVGYGRKVVVEDVNLEVQPGEVLTLIGPNGSGKSTILKTITAQLEKLGGVVYLDGKPQDKLNREEVARTMSLVNTQRLHPEWMTCREMVSMGRYPYTGRLGILSEHDWAKTDQAIKLVHAEDIAEENFNEISDGQRQRIMLARALCQEPEVLVLDEPTSFLDIQFKMDILATIRRAAKEDGVSVILSLHELELASAISDRVACVGGGRIQSVGTPEEILTGENLELLFHLKPGAGEELARGLREYGAIWGRWMEGCNHG
jgi:ABC-type cobalamin/Fe3+-siderophores transport system ATPase subunit